MDELRIWNVARTQSEIAGSMRPLRPQRRYCIRSYRSALNSCGIKGLSLSPGDRVPSGRITAL